MSDGDLRVSIDGRGWRQGSILAPSLMGEIRFADEKATCPADAVAVVIGQDCDVLALKLEDEPVIDVVVGHYVDVADQSYTFAKHPRRIDVNTADPTDPANRVVRLEMRFKGAVARGRLAEIDPAGKLHAGSIRSLAHWAARRYDRAALPDSFNERLTKAKLIHRVRKILKKGENGQPLGVFVALGSQADEELPDDKEYQMALYVVLEGEPEFAGLEWEKFEREVYVPLIALFKTVSGIEVEADQLTSEAGISWRERRVHLRLLSFDDLSLRYDGETAATPHDH